MSVDSTSHSSVIPCTADSGATNTLLHGGSADGAEDMQLAPGVTGQALEYAMVPAGAMTTRVRDRTNDTAILAIHSISEGGAGKSRT